MDQRNLGENPHSRGGYKGGKGGTMPRVEEEASSSLHTHQRHEDFELDIVWRALQHLSTDPNLYKERGGMFSLDDIENKINTKLITNKNPPEVNTKSSRAKNTKCCKNSIGGIILQGPTILRSASTVIVIKVKLIRHPYKNL